MTDYERIKKRLEDAPILLADNKSGDVRLITEADAIQRVTGGAEPVLMLHAGRSVTPFANLDGVGKADREFTLREIATIAKIDYNSAHLWVKRGIVQPSVKERGGRGREMRFSWADAFVAGLCGSLRRGGALQPVLKKVRPLFCETNKAKRTAKKVVTS